MTADDTLVLVGQEPGLITLIIKPPSPVRTRLKVKQKPTLSFNLSKRGNDFNDWGSATAPIDR